MHILILSANTGEGHNSAARALKEYFESRGDSCTVRDGLAYMGRSSNAIISKGHILLYRKLPKLYGVGYRIEEKQAHHQRYQQKLHRHRHLSKSRRQLRALLDSGSYDAVISTHVFAARLVSELRCAGSARIPSFFLATDYTCSPGVNQLDVDAWLIPHPALIPEFAAYGIPEEKLIPAGIPVRAAFMRPRDKAAARRALDLPEDKRIAVFSCGSMGAGAMGKIVMHMLDALPDDALLVAICGSNRALQHALGSINHTEKLNVLGYTDRMVDYMDAADLFLTKPGGLSVTEAARKRLPMLLIDTVPGVESRNMEFMVSLGCAMIANDPADLGETVAVALDSPALLDSLAAGCAREFHQDAAERIHALVREASMEDVKNTARDL